MNKQLTELIEWINIMKTRQWIQGGGEIETIHVPSLIHHIQELQSEDGWISVEVEAMEEALTNPEIYTKADLISKEDAVRFAIWVSNDTFYVYLPISEKWSNGNDMKSSEELFTLYQQTK